MEAHASKLEMKRWHALPASPVLAHTQATPKELVGPCTNTTSCTPLATYCSISEKGFSKGTKHMLIHRQLPTPLEFGRGQPQDLTKRQKKLRHSQRGCTSSFYDRPHMGSIQSRPWHCMDWGGVPDNIPAPPSIKARPTHVLPSQHRVTLARSSAERRRPDNGDVTACCQKTAPSLTHFAARGRPDFTAPLYR